MLSFISSSKIEVLGSNWRRDWAVTLALICAVLLLWEFGWRARGFVPTMTDTPALWAEARRGLKSDSVVLIGSSRMAVGVDPKTFAQATGVRPIQLSINASSPVPVLKHLAEDESFKGTVICDLSESAIIIGKDSQRASRYIDEYENPSLTKRSEFRLNGFLQQHLVTALPELNPYKVLKGTLAGELPQPAYISLYADRTSFADFSNVDRRKIAENSSSYVGEVPSSQEKFLEGAAAFEQYVARIEGRGGRVIFVRMPSSGVQWAHTERTLPKREYWDAFAARTRAATIHFKDYPELSQFECPDYSHLDARDVPAFTKALAGILQARGLF